MITRRFFGLGVAALVTAPAIVRFDAIMPVRSYATGGFTAAEIETISDAALRFYAGKWQIIAAHDIMGSIDRTPNVWWENWRSSASGV